MAEFQRKASRFFCNGIDLNSPVDATKEGRLPIVENVRSYSGGSLRPRYGHTLVHADPIKAGQTPLHSIRRLNDPRTSAFTYITGSGTKLAYGVGPYTVAQYAAADVTISGDPLALIPWRPDQSPQAWMYVADRTVMRKVNVTGTVHNVGLPRPASPPVVILGRPRSKTVDDSIYANDPALQAAWVTAGPVGFAQPTRLTRINTTITAILYDVGADGWACVMPASMAGIGEGCRINFNATEDAIVQEVHSVAAVTTIAGVIYDTGVAGGCSITLTSPVANLRVGAMLYNSTLAEYVRVISVNVGPDGNTSVRVSSAGTFAVGNNIQIVASFRIWLVNTFAAGNTLTAQAATCSVLAGTTAVPSTTFTFPDAVSAALDFSLIAAGLPTHSDDYVHVSFRLDRPDLVSEVKLMFDVDLTTNDFTRNFYYKSFRPSDFTPAVRGQQTTVTTLQTVTRRQLIDDATSQEITVTPYKNFGPEYTEQPTFTYEDILAGTTPPAGTHYEEVTETTEVSSLQFTPGDVQWSELIFRVSDLQRVGTDLSRTIANIAKVRVAITNTATVVFDWDHRSIWIGGGYGPDAWFAPQGYVYRYRGRCNATGVKSPYSPAMRLGGYCSPHRGSVTVFPALHPSTECDVLDIERWGGELSVWHYVGTVLNTGFPSFTDTYGDAYVSSLPVGQDIYQPWPIIDIPRGQGLNGDVTTVSTAGTTVTNSATSFNLSWAPGTVIRINGIVYTIYRVRTTSKLETFENTGTQATVDWKVDEPILENQPLPCLWGPFDGTFFACGDNVNPGRLYYTEGNDPDAAGASDHYIDITPPSEPLMNGVVYDSSRCFVFSSERMFQINPTPGGSNRYSYQEIPGGKGLFSRWAITREPGPFIAFLSSDGIYITEAGAPRSITDADLYPLFPHEGNPGVTVNGFLPPQIYSAEKTNLRLAFCQDYLYFDYTINAPELLQYRTLVYDPSDGGWWPDFTETLGIGMHYGEESPSLLNAVSTMMRRVLCGGHATNAKLYYINGATDSTAAIQCHVRTKSEDYGDFRGEKLFSDGIVDLDNATLAAGVLAQWGFDNHTITTTAVSLAAGATGRDQYKYDIPPTTGQGILARNISLDLDWNTTVVTLLYGFEVSAVPKGASTYLRRTDLDDLGYVGAKYIQGIKLTADTENAARTVNIYADNGLNGLVAVNAAITAQHNGQSTIAYSWVPFVAHHVYFAPTDANLWRIYKWEWIWEPAPDLAANWTTPQTSLGMDTFGHLGPLHVSHASLDPLSLVVTMDGVAQAAIPIAASGSLTTFTHTWLRLPILKGKSYKFAFTSASVFRLYRQDCTVNVMDWVGADYRRVQVFGDESLVSGARI